MRSSVDFQRASGGSIAECSDSAYLYLSTEVHFAKLSNEVCGLWMRSTWSGQDHPCGAKFTEASECIAMSFNIVRGIEDG